MIPNWVKLILIIVMLVEVVARYDSVMSGICHFQA